ncbi:MAG: sigma-54 dependent transcriptional regulator [Planctomycetota bacterium]
MSGEEKILVLVVDDSVDTLEMLQRKLDAEGHRTLTATSVAGAIQVLGQTHVDLVITDLKMPRTSGMDLVRFVRENCRDTEVMVVTGYATVNGAVEAVKTGATEYLSKPFTDKELLDATGRALERLYLRRAAGDRSEQEIQTRSGLLGESKAMRGLLTSVAKAAATAATVLVSGESGTGKELVARAVHYNGPRASAPFVPVNCGGIPETLLESELFGYVKGAFTGATETRAGFFQTAEGGTIFLDEVSETTLAMQVKLLRVLQDREICMVGSPRVRKVNMRILAATNKDLLSLVDKGLFREDFYYRLNVIEINVPPLRERGDDILLLARQFASQFSAEMGRTRPEFSDQVLSILREYNWPGNVRELQNVIQRLVVMTEGDLIDVRDLPRLMRFSALNGVGLDRTLDEVVSEYVHNVLASVGGNKTRAAEILGIDRKTLREKLRK